MARLKKLLDTDLAYHLLVWLLLLVPSIFGTTYNLRAGFAYYTLSFVVRNGVLLSIVYLNFLVLIPRLFRKRRAALYFIAIFFLAVVGVVANLSMDSVMMPRLGFPEQDLNAQMVEALFYFFNMCSYLLTSFLLFSLREKQLQKEHLDELQNDKLTTEIKYLRAQINPHFLFNTLNNLYGLTLQQSPHTGEVILKLSRMMDYMLHESGDVKVYLRDDLENIQNYVDIERIRQGNQAQIVFEIEGSVGEQKIVPLLLLPLIENAFKHGVNTIIQGAYMRARVEIAGNQLEIQVRNNFRSPELTEGRVGIGLRNLERRLHLFYPEKFKMSVRSEAGEYEVNLKLDLS